MPDPDFYPSRIPDLGSRIPKQQQKRGVKKISCNTVPFYVATNFTKLKIIIYFSFEVQKKKILANFLRIMELFTVFTQKMSLVSEIRDPEKTYSGSRIQGSKRHRIPDPDPQHCIEI